MQTLATAPDTAFVASAWGDVLLSLQAIREGGYKKVIYYGAQSGIDRFLAAQGLDVTVINWMGYTDRQGFYSAWSEIAHRTPSHEEILAAILRDHGIDPATVQLCCPDLTLPLKQAKQVTLSDQAQNWVTDLALPEKFILVQPWSFHSTTFSGHWPLWKLFIALLLDNSPIPIVYVNQEEGWPWSPNSSAIDLSGQTPSMEHIFALADRASFVVSTNNGLSHFCNANDIPGLIVANGYSTMIEPLWTDVLDKNLLGVLPCNAPIQWAEMEFMTRFPAALQQS